MKVTNELVFKVLDWLNIKYIPNNEVSVKLRTICHEGDSNKLYFYKNTNIFRCFTQCGNMDLFQFVAKIKNISTKEAFKLVVNDFNVETTNYENIVKNPANKFIHNESHTNKELEPINESYLNMFYDFIIDIWLKEYINTATQKKFEIKYSITKNAIIIPHRDYKGNLVGIRQRNLNKESIENGVKYVPTVINKEVCNYPTGNNLYGFFYNKKSIMQSGKIILFESEKSVMMMNTFFNGDNYSVALSGHNLTQTQIDFLMKLPINEIIFALDKDFKNEDLQTKHTMESILIKKYNSLKNRFNVSFIWDESNILGYKDSPTDRGKAIFLKLLQERLYL